MDERDRLQALLLERITAATQALDDGGSVATWSAAMLRALAQGHTAAALLAARVRDGGPVESLDDADRAIVRDALREQARYLRDFAGEVPDGDQSAAQIAARARLYAGSTRATWSRVRWRAYQLPFHPADGSTPCLTNDKCQWRIEDDDATGEVRAYWELSAAEHCDVCLLRAEANPYIVRNAGEDA